MKIRVLVYRPGHPSSVEEHGNDLASQQGLVDGWIENVYLGEGIVMLCNENGKINDLPFNFTLPGDDIVGTVFFCRIDNESECVSLDDQDIARIRAKVGR